jgi:histone deacetylase complex regulatory component SIN3
MKRFELDRLIESTQSTVNLLEQILKSLKTRRIPLEEIDVESILNKESGLYFIL